MDTIEDKINQVKEALDMLQALNIDALSEEDLQTVSGGLCSIWCCSMPGGESSLQP
jgi:bacteriocin-like protein